MKEGREERRKEQEQRGVREGKKEEEREEGNLGKRERKGGEYAGVYPGTVCEMHVVPFGYSILLLFRTRIQGFSNPGKYFSGQLPQSASH